MGTVYQPQFFPRWRVLYVMHYDTVEPKEELHWTPWYRTQEDAESHALKFLDGHFPWVDFYGFEFQKKE